MGGLYDATTLCVLLKIPNFENMSSFVARDQGRHRTGDKGVHCGESVRRMREATYTTMVGGPKPSW